MIEWPAGLRFGAAMPTLSASWRGGGAALSGAEQRVSGDLGAWRVAIDRIYARGPQQIAAAQAMLTRLRGGESLRAPVCEGAPPPGWRVAAAALTQPAALRSTQLAVSVAGAQIVVGTLLGLGDRVHRVVEILAAPATPPFVDQVAADAPWDDRVTWADATADAAIYVVRVLPALRAAVAAGAVVTLRDLRLLCRLADQGDGEMPPPEGGAATFALNLTETV